MDYSCLDNLERVLLTDSYHRTTLNYAQLAAYIYEKHSSQLNRTYKIQHVVKDQHSISSPLNIKHFYNLIRFREVVPHLSRLLSIGGIWELGCEKAYEKLVRCRIEQVRLSVLGLSFLCLTVFLGHGICGSCLCRSGRGHTQRPCQQRSTSLHALRHLAHARIKSC
jgi:hypothetical protein